MASFAADFIYTAGVTTAAAGALGYACHATGEVLLPGSGWLAAGACNLAAGDFTRGIRHAVHQDLFGRPVDPGAELAGVVVGAIGGHYLTLRLLYPTYAEYEGVARGLTERTMRAQGADIDPRGMRGASHHLDHLLPVRCGYMLAIPPELVASAANLRVITAQANLAIGARGCAG